MNLKKGLLYSLIIIAMLATAAGTALAEDGDLFRRNISKTPELETEKAGIFMMDFYVPAQASTGEPVTIDNYLLADETTSLEPRTAAKPLVTVYIDGPSTHTFNEEEGAAAFIDGGIVFGEMDAFAGISFDDGTTWKTTNISRSADLSSFNLKTGEAYPGHVHNVVHQVFGDNIIIAWVSKYCEGGSPLYSLDLTEYADYLASLEVTYGKDAVYLYDFFGVGGNQGSVDYTEQGFYDVGEIPYSCVWTARGKVLAGDDPSTTDVAETIHTMWTKPERLTSGTRDANLPAVDCAAGAGCMLTWQEDPEGLRPGQGLGPGEGWSGAVAWQQTDIWYSHISQADFDMVFSAEDTYDGGITMADYLELGDGTMPKPYVPMAVPVRLTDNAMCKASGDDPYCYIDFDTLDTIDHTNVQELLDLTAPEADADFCLETLSWLNPGGTTLDLCVTDDNRLLNGRVASTRVRMNLKPYTPADAVDLDGDGVVEKQAWIVMAAEESKALGDTAVDEESDPIDIGKDMFYYSFDPFKTGADEIMIQQGGMINQPAQCNYDLGLDDPLCTGIDEGGFYPVQLDGRGYEFYLTEIARRFALTTNSVADAVASESGLSAMLIYKQGIINQGGPADILLRRVVIDDTVFDPAVDNPYAFENMACDEWVYTDGTNPNYLQGLCLSPAINITGTTIVRCDAASGDSDACADTFPMNDDGSNNVSGDFPKVYEWRQCDGGTSIDGCEEDSDLDDQTWANPFDVAKGHRGFLDKDYVMMMYAWSPNWNSNSVGNDHYNLYVRRSFDGGLTWTTTPAALEGAGVTALENYYETTPGEPVPTYFEYGAGDFEQGRNVSLLVGNQVTILDPRYSPTGGMKLYSTISTQWLADNSLTVADTLPYEDDAVRDPSKYFMVYETGDNTTVAVGEATPLDLFYSRATVYGDIYEWFDYVNDDDDCNPVPGEEIDWSTCLEPRWPWLENKADILSGEAAVVANPGGTFLYNVWNQWEEEITFDEFGVEHELVFNSDMPFRRLLYLMDDTEIELDPLVSWLYEGTTFYATLPDEQEGDILSLAVTGRDLDKVGDGEDITGYLWKMIIVDENGNELAQRVLEDCTGQTCNVKIRTLSEGWDGFGQDGGSDYVGWAQIQVQSIDNDWDPDRNQLGNYSKKIQVNINIAEYWYRTRLPMIVR